MGRKGKKEIVVNVNTGKSKRQRRRERVKQAEVTALGRALRVLGGVGGGVAGEYMGNRDLGAYVGTGLGGMISRWLGQGSYRVSSNSVVSNYQSGSGSIPAMHKSGQSVTVRHREFLTSIKGSQDFVVQRFFFLQPADRNTFPWLSGIAPHFQQYRIKGMVYHYVPTSGYAVSGSNPAIGSVMMQTSYRVNDDPPATKVEMLNEYWACESSPVEAFCHPIECAPKENPFNIHYTRTAPVPANDSPLLYDMGVTYVATSGMPAGGNVVGDLWVTYEIEFSKPLVASNTTSTVLSGTMQVPEPVPAAWFGAGNYAVTGSLKFTATERTITFPLGLMGVYLVVVDIEASSTFAQADLSGAPDLLHCTLVKYWSEDDYVRTVVPSGTINRLTYSCALRLTDPSAQAAVRFPAGTWGGAASDLTASITQVA